MKTVFGFDTTGKTRTQFYHTIKEQNHLLDISGFDYFCQVSSVDANIHKSESSISVSYIGKNREVRIR